MCLVLFGETVSIIARMVKVVYTKSLPLRESLWKQITFL